MVFGLKTKFNNKHGSEYILRLMGCQKNRKEGEGRDDKEAMVVELLGKLSNCIRSGWAEEAGFAKMRFTTVCFGIKI